MLKTSGAAFAFGLVWSTSATAIETPAARLYRALTDVCLDHYLKNKELNTAQLITERPLIVHCDCMARFFFFSMDTEAIRQLETRIPDKISSTWDDAASEMLNSNSPLAALLNAGAPDAARPTVSCRKPHWAERPRASCLGSVKPYLGTISRL
jgi:hypothetical protein